MQGEKDKIIANTSKHKDIQVSVESTIECHCHKYEPSSSIEYKFSISARTIFLCKYS